jgi:hypothetical protein
MRRGGALRPGPEPDYLDIGTEDLSGQLRDFLCYLPRPSHEFFIEHGPSVAVLLMMSTGLDAT